MSVREARAVAVVRPDAADRGDGPTAVRRDVVRWAIAVRGGVRPAVVPVVPAEVAVVVAAAAAAAGTAAGLPVRARAARIAKRGRKVRDRTARAIVRVRRGVPTVVRRRLRGRER